MSRVSFVCVAPLDTEFYRSTQGAIVQRVSPSTAFLLSERRKAKEQAGDTSVTADAVYHAGAHETGPAASKVTWHADKADRLVHVLPVFAKAEGQWVG